MAEKKKSNTVHLQLPVIFEWAKVFRENMDKEGPNGAYKGHGGAYVSDLIMTKEVFQQLEDAGSQKIPSVQNKDGKWLSEKQWKTKEQQGISYLDALEEAEKIKVKVMRKHDAPYTYGGPPQVAHADGTPWDYSTDGAIGNGSSGIAYISVYEAGGLKGTRLDGIQVMEHVEYISDYEPDEEGEGGGGLRIPDRTKDAGTKAKKPAAAKPKVEPIEDEIPF